MSSKATTTPSTSSHMSNNGPAVTPSSNGGETKGSQGGGDSFSRRDKWQSAKVPGTSLVESVASKDDDNTGSQHSISPLDGEQHQAALIETKSEESKGKRKKGKTTKKREGGTKKKKNKQNNGHPKPKRPMSAYNFFFRDERLKILAEMGKSNLINDGSSNTNVVSFEDMGKLIGRRWKTLESKTLAKYNALADVDSKRYKAELTKYYDEEDARRRASYFSHIVGASGTGISSEASPTSSQVTNLGQNSQVAAVSSVMPSQLQEAGNVASTGMAQQTPDPQFALAQLNQFLLNLFQQQAANTMVQQQLLKALQQQANPVVIQLQGQNNAGNDFAGQATLNEASASSNSVAQVAQARGGGGPKSGVSNPTGHVRQMPSFPTQETFQGRSDGSGMNGHGNLNNAVGGVNIAALLYQLQNGSQAQQQQQQQQMARQPFGQQMIQTVASPNMAAVAAQANSGHSALGDANGTHGAVQQQQQQQPTQNDFQFSQGQNGGGQQQQQQFQNGVFPNALQIASLMSMIRKN